MADQVLYSGVACITDLMVKEGLINLDFADVRAVMREMGKAMMGTGEASGEKRALAAAEAAISNPLIDDASMKGARGLLISITGGKDLTLYEVDEAATRIREEVDQDANIIVGATFDENLDGIIRVSVVATGIEQAAMARSGRWRRPRQRIAEVTQKLRADVRANVPTGLSAARRRGRLDRNAGREQQPVRRPTPRRSRGGQGGGGRCGSADDRDRGRDHPADASRSRRCSRSRKRSFAADSAGPAHLHSAGARASGRASADAPDRRIADPGSEGTARQAR